MKVYLIRHAESEWNAINKIQGHSDPELTNLGIKQAEKLALSLSGDSIKKIYTSHLKRATATAKILLKYINVPMITDKDLSEIYLGEWEGKTPEEVDTLYDFGYREWLLGPTNKKIPGAEPVQQFKKRVRDAFYNILKAEEEDFIILTHGGVIATIICMITGEDFDKMILNTQLSNTGITLLECENRKFRILKINDTMHLDSEGEMGADIK